MASTSRGRTPAPEDLTARSRIRDAALLQFAQHGIKGATFRGIAEAAGVSVGLVQHHFGSKDALRQACDAYALDVVRSNSTRSTTDEAGDPGFLAAAMRADLPVRRYLARALVDGSPAAAQLFDDMVDLTERYLKAPPTGVSEPATRDLRAYSAAVAAMTAGVVVLHEHLSRVLDTDTLTAEGSPRLRRAVLEVFDDRLLSREIVARGHAGLDMYEAAPAAEGDDDD
ncbi:TetR/AcrR family transcriptional regulator [Actinomadura macra]|uniref:TetR/AcrR family transcriptional regulator n=1 Tax=Actinomadura macra TaxID=46164 RepID=UPI0008355C20|nr:TetR/AcrR family transcriptional regulator [Actinomadura macra]